ncbi:Inosine/uridine-preferring nucleoside hydrolase domain-containing protein [Glomus cerebriforme]|uniref:Inosine/uridine-preferring nucleoside hydrolase domain-containing protein n=1 Tax=Glomus cerebriforme TaxID=658196 RepID=A0A397SZI8_9GLOM|nr:Inosine/uridine-preferring nucleoside hydrolase domain-containing protein [Glomus cerebriforme]
MFSILDFLIIYSIFINSVIASHEHQKPPLPVIIDTDGYIDDFLAILYALKSRELDVRGVTYLGDGWSHAASAQNIVDIIDDIYPGKNLPVILGANYDLFESDRNPKTLGSPGCFYQKSVSEIARNDADLLYGLNRQLRLSKRIWYDALTGFNITQNFADLIDSTIKQTGKKPTIIATGPATNIVTFLRAFPTYTKRIEKIVWMGGSLNVYRDLFTVPSNTLAEYNLYLDCVAAQELLAYDLNILLVPIDFTNETPLNPGFFDKLSKLTSFYGKFTYRLLSTTRAVSFANDSAFYNNYFLWDPKAVAVVKNIGISKIVSNRKLAVTCEGKESIDGQFMKSQILTKANFKIAIDAIVSDPVDDSPFFNDFLDAINKD